MDHISYGEVMKEPKNDKNNNFFNQNPLLTFAIFSVVIILVFKTLVGDENSALGSSMSQGAVKNKEVTYSELKKMISSNSVNEVSIGQNYIRGFAQEGSRKVVYTARLVHQDPDLIKLLDEKGIEYKGFSESNWFTDMFGWLLPFFIIMAIWMFFAGRMQKSMGGGILGMGNSKKTGQLRKTED
jgi:cell division protease FtsH